MSEEMTRALEESELGAAVAQVEALATEVADDEDDEQLVEPPGDGEEQVAGAEQLLDELLLEAERPQGAQASYGYDRRLAERGKWFNWRRLGASARLKIAKTKNQGYVELWDKAVRQHGNKRTGQIPLAKRRELLPVIHAKTLLTGMEGVVLADPRTGEVLSTVERVEFQGEREVRKAYTFQLAPDGTLADTLLNRVRLLLLFAPDLDDEIFEVADNIDNFRDDDPEVVRGN